MSCGNGCGGGCTGTCGGVTVLQVGVGTATDPYVPPQEVFGQGDAYPGPGDIVVQIPDGNGGTTDVTVSPGGTLPANMIGCVIIDEVTGVAHYKGKDTSGYQEIVTVVDDGNGGVTATDSNGNPVTVPAGTEPGAMIIVNFNADGTEDTSLTRCVGPSTWTDLLDGCLEHENNCGVKTRHNTYIYREIDTISGNDIYSNKKIDLDTIPVGSVYTGVLSPRTWQGSCGGPRYLHAYHQFEAAMRTAAGPGLRVFTMDWELFNLTTGLRLTYTQIGWWAPDAWDNGNNVGQLNYQSEADFGSRQIISDSLVANGDQIEFRATVIANTMIFEDRLTTSTNFSNVAEERLRIS